MLATTLRISGPNTIDIIVKAYNNDIYVTTLRSQQPDAVLLRYQDRIYVSNIYVKEVIRDYYNNPLQGYPRVSKTIELLGRGYAAPKLRARVE